MSKLTVLLRSVLFAYCIVKTAHAQVNAPAPLAYALSPGKPPGEQKRIAAAVLKTLATHGATIEGRYGVHLFDDHGRMENPISAINKMSNQIMQERGWTTDRNMMQYVQIKTFGIVSGSAFYRAWKIDHKIDIINCENRQGRFDEIKLLRSEVCSEMSNNQCNSLISLIHQEMANRHPEWSRWLDYSYIDDYGLPCRPYATFKDIAIKMTRSYRNTETRRRIMIANFGVTMGLSLFLLSKNIDPDRARITTEAEDTSEGQSVTGN